MFAYILILVPWLVLTFLSSTVESLFSSEELTEMGICLENPYTMDSQ